MENKKDLYYKVYDFTNENVSCLNSLYHFDNSKVLSAVGSGDQYFASVLNGAKKIDLFDINPTSYLYFILKFYVIRELTYEEFYDLLINKNFTNIYTYMKLENVLPIEVLKYYKYLILYNNKKNNKFRDDTINLLTKSNKKYYFKTENPVIPYLKKDCYYKLQELLRKEEIPKFIKGNVKNIKSEIKGRYDIILMSNIYNSLNLGIEKYTNFLKELDAAQIQACYDWYGLDKDLFVCYGYKIDIVKPSSPTDFVGGKNYVYSLIK